MWGGSSDPLVGAGASRPFVLGPARDTRGRYSRTKLGVTCGDRHQSSTVARSHYFSAQEGVPSEEFLPKRKQLKIFQIGAGTGKVGDLFVKSPKANPPRWATLFAEYVEAAEMGRVSSSSAVFISKTHGRFFAITFGQGR